MTDELPMGWKLELLVTPIVYQDKILVYKPHPHTEESDKSNQYRYAIKNELARQITGAFVCPVKLEMDFFVDNRRPSYPTGYAQQLARCLVPDLVADVRLLREVTSRVHYPPEKVKEWTPRIELTVLPILDG